MTRNSHQILSIIRCYQMDIGPLNKSVISWWWHSFGASIITIYIYNLHSYYYLNFMYFCVNVIKNLNLNGQTHKLSCILSITLIVMLTFFVAFAFLISLGNICCHQEYHHHSHQDVPTNFVSLDHKIIEVSIPWNLWFTISICHNFLGEG